MFSLATLLPFIAGALALIASPGPDFIYVLSRGIAQGPRAGVFSALGIALGLCVHTTVAVLGLAALLRTSVVAFNVLKWAGAFYLVYLGVQTLRSRDTLRFDSEEVPLAPREVIRQGFLTNVLNVKAMLTFALFLPTFVHPGKFSQAAQIAILGLMMVVMAGSWFSLVGSFAGKVGGFLRRQPQTSEWVRVGAGVLFVLIGFYIMFKVQQAPLH